MLTRTHASPAPHHRSSSAPALGALCLACGLASTPASVCCAEQEDPSFEVIATKHAQAAWPERFNPAGPQRPQAPMSTLDEPPSWTLYLVAFIAIPLFISRNRA